MTLVDYGPKPSGPTHPPRVPPPPPPPPPPPQPRPKTLRIGNPPRLPLAARRAHLLRQLGRYLLAWGLVGVGCYWMALGSTGLGLALIAIAGFTCGPRPVRRPR